MPTEPLQGRDLDALFARAEREGRIGRARKTAVVDARPARPGEIVVTVIKGEGEETRSPPAAPGDRVVRNRSTETGNEEILVAAATFAERYEGPLAAADADGWQPYRPRGNEMLYFMLREDEAPLSFVAPWGEPMIARAGDALVRNPEKPEDSYRIAAAAFAATYEIVAPPKTGNPRP
jgi:hypothetical protein